MPSLRLAAIAASALASAIAATASAPAASAATAVDVTCTESSITIYGVPGDEYTFTFGGICDSDWELYNTPDYNSNGWLAYGPDTGGWWRYITPGNEVHTVTLMAQNYDGLPLPSAGSAIAEVDNDGAGTPPTIIIPIIYGGTTAPAPSGGETPISWTIIRQSVPMPAAGSCDDVQDDAQAWGTGASGGWVKAWEPWVAPEGGWACSRDLLKKGSAAWQVSQS